MTLAVNGALKNESQEIETSGDESVAPVEEDEGVQHNPDSSGSERRASTEPTTRTTNGSSGLGSSTGGDKSSKCVASGRKEHSPERRQRRRTKTGATKYASWMEWHGNLKETTICALKADRRMNRQQLTTGEITHNNAWFYRIPDNRIRALHKSHHEKDGKVIKVKPLENNGLHCSPKTSREVDVDHFMSRRRSTFVTASKEEASPTSISFTAAATATTTFVGHNFDGYRHSHRSRSRRKWFSPEEVIERFGSSLTEYERGEIAHYKKIWYFGRGVAKTTGRNEPYNNGFDNKKGEYKTIPHDHIAYRYEVIDTIGRGAFGEVVAAYDHRNRQRVALKIIRNRPNLHEQAKVEAKMLSVLMRRDPKGKNFTLRMFDDFTFRNHPCIVCELIGENLFEVLKRRDFRGLPTKVIRGITRCCLKCLTILKEESIIHCDIKPENILVFPDDKAHVKLIDFGSSCRESEQIYNYIQSRYYRAPEVILGLRYSTLIDMWSLGCVLAELYTGAPLFPGVDEADQLRCITRLLGAPPEEMAEKSPTFKKLVGENSCPAKVLSTPPKSFDEEFDAADPLFKDFILKCLTWRPEDRMTVEEALKHPWITHDKSHKHGEKTIGSLAGRNHTVCGYSLLNSSEPHGLDSNSKATCLTGCDSGVK
ncbi:dual specificity [Echinococcus multilocularis]|uniref:dual-specificity kinase n=1 Tax=Echinococcus multilocularis TaxID=6211 RepID=A0A068Y032_ECHMU|nr:dual specificity [Echinococcus multilocularis]